VIILGPPGANTYIVLYSTVRTPYIVPLYKLHCTVCTPYVVLFAGAAQGGRGEGGCDGDHPRHPGANYRVVWTTTRNFPHVKTFVRAHDVDHGVNLEKAGATAVSTLSTT